MQIIANDAHFKEIRIQLNNELTRMNFNYSQVADSSLKLNKIKSENTCLYRNKFSMSSESKSKLNVTCTDSRIVWHFAAMLNFRSHFEMNTKRTQPIFEVDFCSSLFGKVTNKVFSFGSLKKICFSYELEKKWYERENDFLPQIGSWFEHVVSGFE